MNTTQIYTHETPQQIEAKIADLKAKYAHFMFHGEEQLNQGFTFTAEDCFKRAEDVLFDLEIQVELLEIANAKAVCQN